MTIGIAGTMSAPSHGVNADAAETQKSMAANLKAIREASAELEFVPDTTTMAQMRDGVERRIAKATCRFCNGTQALPQVYELGAERWSPDAGKVLEVVLGWTHRDAMWFCGKTCDERHKAYSKAHGDHSTPIVPVTTPIVPGSSARAAYATTKPIDTKDVTPAAPPVTASRKGK